MEVSFENPTNVWIGPTSTMLVQLGAVFPPCLRKDVLITLRFAKYYGHEAAGLGCCEIAGSGAGQCYSLIILVHKSQQQQPPVS